MQKKYGDLHRLMQEDKRAKDYFDSLPEYVRKAVSQRPQGVNSLESLKSYAENLTRGDH
jgi:hypothetical protein